MSVCARVCVYACVSETERERVSVRVWCVCVCVCMSEHVECCGRTLVVRKVMFRTDCRARRRAGMKAVAKEGGDAAQDAGQFTRKPRTSENSFEMLTPRDITAATEEGKPVARRQMQMRIPIDWYRTIMTRNSSTTFWSAILCTTPPR